MARKLSRCDVESIIGRLDTPMLAECWSCECMQGFLIQLQLDGDQQASDFVRTHILPAVSLHSCLGCDPCPPADAYAEYVRRKQTIVEDSCGCSGCCG